MARKKLDWKVKQSITVNFRLNPIDAGIMRAAYKIQGDRNLTAFIYRTIMPVANSIVNSEKEKRLVTDETIR